MNTHNARRFSALLFISLFGAMSIGGDGCWIYTQPTANPDCCLNSDTHWACKIQVQTQAVMDQPSVHCYAAEPLCAGSEAQAKQNAINQATINYMRGNQQDGMLTVSVQSVICARLAACINSTYPQSAPLDTPGACETLVTVDAGPSCAANNAACTGDADCCSGTCSDWGACEQCRMDTEGCTTNGDCCSGLCTLNACGG